MTMFMGKPMEYWIDLNTQVDMLNLDDQLERNLSQKKEIYSLRAKVSYYENKINDMNTFMKLHLEVKA